MSKEAFEKCVEDLLRSIEVCLKNKLQTPSLVLVYATIDIMAWLDLPKYKYEASNKDFIWWVNKYLLPGTGLTCDAKELWGARCGLVHTYTPESWSSRKGKVRMINYAFGPRQADDLQRIIDLKGNKSIVPVQIDDLFLALRSAIDRFRKALSDDLEHADIVYKRAGKLFIPIYT